MSALEKSAWSELAVVLVALAAVAICLPLLGAGALAGFSLLGLLPIGMYFFRKRGNKIIFDERDLEIQRRATSFGIYVAWGGMFLALIATILWYGGADSNVPKRFLEWIVYLQLSGFYGLRAAATIFAYRGQHSAA